LRSLCRRACRRARGADALPGQPLIIGAELRQHLVWSNTILIAIGDELMVGDIANRANRGPTDLDAFGNPVDHRKNSGQPARPAGGDSRGSGFLTYASGNSWFSDTAREDVRHQVLQRGRDLLHRVGLQSVGLFSSSRVRKTSILSLTRTQPVPTSREGSRRRAGPRPAERTAPAGSHGRV